MESLERRRLWKDAPRAIPNMGFNLVHVESVCYQCQQLLSLHGDESLIEVNCFLRWLMKRVSGFGIGVGSGYQQKDRKPSQNDKTEHGMEKTVQNQGQSPKMPKSESILKISSQKPEPRLKNTIWSNHNPSDGREKPNIISYERLVKPNGPINPYTAHLCAIDKDCEDFEGPILAQLQPISAIVHTKPTP
ncbi:hypothetical protein Tco_1312419 [Tanacetum coccineum]